MYIFSQPQKFPDFFQCSTNKFFCVLFMKKLLILKQNVTIIKPVLSRKIISPFNSKIFWIDFKFKNEKKN